MLERVQRKGNPLTLLAGMQTSRAIWRTVWRFLDKLELELPYDPAIPLLGIHTEETRIERHTCTPVFTAALFIIARTWKQPRCPSLDKWIRKLCMALRASALERPWGMGMCRKWDVGGGFRMGNTCTPMADSCRCMAKKTLQYCNVISVQLKKKKKKPVGGGEVFL